MIFPLLVFTETWLNEKSPADLIKIEGYKLLRADRKYGRGGGVAFYIADTLTYKIRYDLTLSTSNAEILSIEVNVTSGNSVILCVIYRPPNTKFNMELFFEDMENLLSKINVSNKTCCLMGDFNIDLAQENDSSLTFRNNYAAFKLIL